MRAISVYDSHNRYCHLQFTSSILELQDRRRGISPVTSTSSAMATPVILRTPIVSESYSPDESAKSDAKMPGQYAGLRRLELDLQNRFASEQYKEFLSQRNDAVLYRHRVNLRLETDALTITGPIRNGLRLSTASAADSWTAGSKALCSANWIC
ncbi:hypothetical protein MJ575_23335 [Klebsiella pneumoniae]|nr:hypothetical protein MJ575_23335 [Klebsiella pneumoniae]